VSIKVLAIGGTDAAKIVSYSTSAIYKMAAEGKFPGALLVGRRWVIPVEPFAKVFGLDPAAVREAVSDARC
jgi:hypothetical protein